MKRKNWFLILLGGFCISIVYILYNFSITQSQPIPTSTSWERLLTPIIRSSPTRPAYCVSLPKGQEVLFTPSPLPTIVRNPGDSLTQIYPKVSSPTPDITSMRHDTVPNLPEEEKLRVYIFRCNGTMDLFLFPYGGINYSEYYTLGIGDVIYDIVYPKGVIGQKPPAPTIKAMQITTTTPSRTSTFVSYPFPATSTALKRAISPYPAPFSVTPQP